MEEKTLDYIRRLFKQLNTTWPTESHWFCPKRRDDDFLNYGNIQDADAEAEEEGLTSADKARLISEWESRQEIAYQLCIVYGLSVEEGAEWQDLHHKRLTELLSSCDRCVRNYHMGRKGFLKEVAEEYDDDLVAQLSERINKMDFLRIDQGLERAHNLLAGTPDPQKGPKALMKEPSALTALYEALCCSSYHTSPQKLRSAFDSPFKLVQQKKTLRLGDILPASARFLFQPDGYRLRFAQAAWEDLNKNLHQTTFDWSIQDALTDAIISVSQIAPILEVQRFWEGVLLILDKLDKPLITHSVRGMEVQPDLYHLALQHLAHYDSEDVLELIIQALRKLLMKSPEDFWSAYGALSSTTIAEQIFTCKAFDRLLASSQHIEVIDSVKTPSALAWISPFVISLPPAQQFDVCRSLLYHLLERFQGDTAQHKSKLFCFQAGLNVLLNTLVTFVDPGYKINSSTSYIVVNNILGLVAKYKAVIIDSGNLLHDKEENKELSRLGMQVMRNGLALCCKSMQAEFQALVLKRDIRHELDSYSRPIWQSALDGLRRDSLDMGKNILIGLTPLVGLDKVKTQSLRDLKGRVQADPLLKSKSLFNKDFDLVIEIVSRVFQRLSDFSPQNLDQLCQNLITAYPLFASLMPPDQATYEASVEMIKIMTGKSGRKAAISKLLQESLTRTLTALSWASRRISKYETFAGIPYLLKTSRDVLNSLCDAQHGLLRMKASTTSDEQKAMAIWWSEQWEVMSTAFKNYEQWALGSDTSFMTEVCRDIMEYSDLLFDQYSVLASALDGASSSCAPGSDRSELSHTSRANLLEYPRRAMEYLVRWLRLRDTYLLSILVNLLCKILRRLGEFDMEVASNALTMVEMVGSGEDKKYKVTAQQMAELRRALEEHRGLAEIEMTEVEMAGIEKSALLATEQEKTSSITSREKMNYWSRPKNSSSELTLSTLNDDVRSLSTSLERGSSTMDMIRARARKPTMPDLKDMSMISQSFKDSREKAKEEKRQRDAKMIAEAKALRAPRVLPPNEGTAAKGGAVKGGPTVKGQGVMVSSDSSSDDNGTGIKALINKRVERSKKGTEQEQSLRRALNQQQLVPVKKTKIQRSLNDMRARLVPNMDVLHLTILKWDIFVEGDQPPGGIDCEKVADRFRTAQDYYDTFYPLLIAEAWRSLSTAREENNFKPFGINVVNRISVDVFFEVATTIQIADNRDNNISEGDIVLLSKGQDPLKERHQVSCLSRVYRVTRKKDVLEISYRVSGQASGNSGLLSALAPNVKIRGVKITSLTTIEREYGALKSLQYYDLCEEILAAQPSPILAYPEHTLNPIRKIYGLNMGQAKAIWSAKQNDAFTLVQGPPGSGKTKTIIAMVGALLTDRFIAHGVPIKQSRGMDNKSSNDTQVPRKLLICAPSNAAVDEIVSRLKEGVKTLKGEFRKINVIRLGRSEAIDANVKDVTLDELVRARMEGDGKSGTLVISEREKLHLEAGRLKEALSILRPKLDEARSMGDADLERRIQREVDEKKREQGRIGARIDDQKANGNTAARENEITRRRLQQEIIDSAHVLCSTLSGSGHEMFRNLSVEFETVIIDEAAQCIELSALIPLKYGCSKCILVGDPKQLPPTVLSRSAARYGYEQSLFVRMQQNHPKDVHLLDTQYRMHPEISDFPRKQFYDGQLIDGENLKFLRKKPWHASPLLGPYRFFDVKGTQTTGARGHSFINMAEIALAIQIYEHLKRILPKFDFSHKIGIITPYKAQLGELRRSFQRRYGESVIDEIEFNTTDAFQGRESEIIIFSCVRARASGGIGFLNDIRRMNVGLTRAKSSLWVLGDSASLMQGPFWARLVEDAKARQRYTEGNIQKMLKGEVQLDNDVAISPTATGQPKTESLNNDISMSPTATGRPKTESLSPRSSIESVEMTDAPQITEERRSSPDSIDSSSTLRRVSSKRKREPSPSDEARRLGPRGTSTEAEGSTHDSVEVSLEKDSDLQKETTATTAGNSQPRIPPIARKVMISRRKAADPLMRNRPPPRPSR